MEVVGGVPAWIARGGRVAPATVISIRRSAARPRAGDKENALMAKIEMRLVSAADIPADGGTAVQDTPDRPVFRGLDGDDYVCAHCGNVLATKMAPEYMNAKLRIKCARCRKINAAVEVEGVDYKKAFGRGAVFGEGAVGADRRQ